MGNIPTVYASVFTQCIRKSQSRRSKQSNKTESIELIEFKNYAYDHSNDSDDDDYNDEEIIYKAKKYVY